MIGKRRDDLAVALLWAVFLTAAAAAVIWAAVATVESVVKLAIGIVTAAGAILTAVVTHTLNQMREREQEILRRKQDNYAELVRMIAPYVRFPDEQRDKIAGAHLFSWVVASPDVVAKTRVFLDSRTDKPKALGELLLKMRRDLGMEEGELRELSLQGLFPAVETKKAGEL